MNPPPDASKAEIALRVILFAVFAWPSWIILGWAIQPVGGLLVASALSTFGAGLLANGLTGRIFGRGSPAEFGLGWFPGTGRQFLLGAGSGIAAGVAVVTVAVATRAAAFERIPAPVAHPWGAALFLTLALLFGAAGEELLYRGYAFQILVRAIGPFATILPVSVLFGLSHLVNENTNVLGIFNTIAWGVLLGYAYLRTQALWLPIGIHFGWNVALPLLGTNLSGFAMSITAYRLEWSAPPVISGGGYGPEGGILTTLVVAAMFWIVVRITPQPGFTMDAEK